MKRAPWEHSSLASLVASGKPKRKHCSKRISQEQEEKENSKKSRPFKQMPPRRAPVFLLSPGINTRGTTLPPRWIYFVSRGLVSTNQIFFASETKTERKNRKTGARELSSLFLVFPPFDFQMAKEAPLNSLKISEMSLTILSYMHVLCRRADLLKKSTFLGIIILIFFACALRHCRVMTGYYVTLKYQAKLRTIAWKVFATLKWLDST